MKKLTLLVFILSLVLAGCKKNDDNALAEGARDNLYYIMDSLYLWNAEMPAVNVEDYSNPYDLLEALRYTPTDKWSFVADYDEFVSEMQGDFVGHGIRIGLDNNNLARIITIYKGGDMYSKGVRRGWIVKSINGTQLAPILIAKDEAAYNALMGASKAGITNTFVFQKPDGTDVSINSTKAAFTINTVMAYDTLHLTSGVTGYLCFDAFLQNSGAELDTAFKYFTTHGATDLIVDLRYNTGGYVDVAQQLASEIIGSGHTNETFINYKYNSKCSLKYNSAINFLTTKFPMGLSRVVFITSGSSASASEVVISSLMPYIDVTLVGDDTYGKPCGMNLFHYKYTYVFAPVTFEYTNSDDYGQFYDGIPCDIAATDDITHDFGDRRRIMHGSSNKLP